MRKYKVKSLKDFLNLERKKVKDIIFYLFRKNILRSKNEIISFHQGISMFPIIQIYYSIKNLNEEEIYLHDLMNFKIKVIRISKTVNLSKQIKNIDCLEKLHTVHTFFPSKLHEKWICIIEQENIEFIKSDALPPFIGTCSLNFSLFACNLGLNEIIISMLSDSYVGLDISRLIYYKVSSRSKKQIRGAEHPFSFKTKSKDVYRYSFENKFFLEGIIAVLCIYILYSML